MAKKRGRPPKNPETVTQTKKDPTPFEQTVGKKLDKYGKVRATVMTKAASQIADEKRKNADNTNKYYNKDCVYRPKG